MTDETIFRVAKDADHPYSMISNALLQNKKLSLAARGLMGYLLSKPDNWQVRMTDLLSCGGTGLGALRTILSELQREGYIIRSRVRNKDGTYRWDTEVRETPRRPTDGSTTDGSSIGGLSTDGSPADIVNTDLPMTELSTNGVPSVDASATEPSDPSLDSQKKTRKPNQKTIPPSDGDAPPSEAQQHREITKTISAYFEEATGLTVPIKGGIRGIAKLWWNPIRDICFYADWDIQLARKLIASSVARLRRDNMTISSPNSLIKTVVGIRAEWRSGTSPPSPPSRPLTGGSWRSPLTGEEHYEGKPKPKDSS